MKIYILGVLMLLAFITKSQITNIPDNELLQNITTIEISPDQKFEPTPEPAINTTSDQKEEKTDRLRRIYFIHGLGGTGDSWTKAADACMRKDLNVSGFSARNCITWPRVDYNLATNGDLFTAADLIRTEIQTNFQLDKLNPIMDNEDDRAFLIAHSQGGVVSRAIIYSDLYSDPWTSINNKGYGGLVTVCSPLQGAMILNNRNQIQFMAYDACNSLIKGPTSNTYVRTIIKLLGKDLNDINSSACQLTSFNLLPIFFKDNMTNITNDYHVGSILLNSFTNDLSLNTSYQSMPKIAFYGVEPRNHIFWRTVNWFVNSPNDIAAWSANDDFVFFNKTVVPMFNDYTNNYLDNKNKLTNLEANKYLYFSLPVLGSTINLSALVTSYTASVLYYNSQYDNYTNQMNAWKSGVDWFYRVNAQWEVVIGSRFTTSNTLKYFKCWCLEDPTNPKDGMNVSYDNPEEACAPCMFTGPWTLTTYTTHYKESDGVVLAESANNLPKATHEPIKMQGKLLTDGTYSGTSHMQARNDEALKINLTNLFDGLYGGYFYIEPK